MDLSQFLMVALTTVFLPLVWSQNYCSISPEHTMCKSQGSGPACNGEVLRRGVTQEEINEILDSHNRYRGKIARGEEKRGQPGPQPPASNMRKLVWDDELAVVAQRHADQCVFAHDCSDCRRVDRFGVGQNLYIYKQSLRLPDNKWEKAVTDWYDEVALFGNREVEPFVFSKAIGHYSQLVWADTDKVGCGATSYRDGKWFSTLYTCNYGPNGNYVRGQMYKQGSACSACSENHACSRDVPGLCESSSNVPILPVFNSAVAPAVAPTFAPAVAPTFAPAVAPTFAPAVAPPEFSKPKIFTPEAVSPASPVFIPGRQKPEQTFSNNRNVLNRFFPLSATSTTTPRPFTPSVTTTSTTRRTTARSTTTYTTQATTQRIKTTLATTTTQIPFRDTSVNSTLFYCGFENELKECSIRSGGVKWQKNRNSYDGVPNHYFAALLSSGDNTEVFFENLIIPPTSGVACLDFRYKKYSSGSSVPLTVLVWPFKGKPGRVNISRDSPNTNTWIRAQITFRNIDNYFLVMLKSPGPSNILGRLFLAIDDVTVLEGSCNE